MLKLKKPLCVAMAALSIMGAATVPTVSYLTSNSAGIVVSAEAATSNKAYFLKDNYNAKTKTYNQSFQENYRYVYHTVWRSGNTTVNIKSSNTNVVKTRKVKNSKGYYDYQFAACTNTGKATVTVTYKDGKKDIIKVIVCGKSSRTTVELGQSMTYKYKSDNSGIAQIINKNGHVQATTNGATVTLKGLSVNSGAANTTIIYKSGLIEDLVVSVIPSKATIPMIYSYNTLIYNGVINYNGDKYTYYSQSVLPGGGLNIPGRHVDGGYVCDADGYIVLALPISGKYKRYQVINTPFGKKGKFYDACDGNSIDVYVQ